MAVLLIQLVGFGVGSLVLGGLFTWLNLNSPIQTRLPMPFFVAAAVSLYLAALLS